MDPSNQHGTRALVTKGALFLGAAQIYRVGAGFASSVVLARLLLPADFGLIAMVSSLVALITLIQDLGLGQATVQRAHISPRQLSALFWISVASSFILALALACCAPAIAWFFNDSRLIRLTIAFAIIVALSGIQSQHLALMNRELRFKALSGIDVLAVTASAITGVTVAWLTASYWALFASSLLSTLVSVICVWAVCKFRPGPPAFEGDFREIIRFGSGVSGFNIVNYFARNADNVLIGKFYGSQQLGYYDRAYRLLLFPLSQALWPVGRIMLPLLARLQTDPERYRKAYVECVSLVMIALQPGIVFSVIFADDIFRMLFGPQWLPAVPVYRWLGLCGLAQVMTSPTGWLFLSQGRGAEFFRVGVVGSCLTVGSFLIGISWGPIGLAMAYTITYFATILPLSFWASGRLGPISGRCLMLASLPHALATAVAAGATLGIRWQIPLPGAAICLGSAAVDYGVYLIVIAFFPDKRVLLVRNFKTFIELSRPFSRLARS